jgi:exoribonuclease-2
MTMQRRDRDCHRDSLVGIAHQAMIDKGLDPDFGKPVEQQLATLAEPAKADDASFRDLRDRAWCSIDNDDSRDLDQLTVAEDLGDGRVRLLVAVADVDALVKKGTPIDAHAQKNTTSVYTAGGIFSMLPEKLSTNLTSLNEGEDRIAIIIEMTVTSDGSVEKGDVYRGRVHNQAQLAYDAVGEWLEGGTTAPAKVEKIAGLGQNLRLQDRTADWMRGLRHENGALDLETIEARAVFADDKVVDLRQERRNNARMLIEDCMIGANGVTARFLAARGLPSLRRVVRSPERWDRIEKIAADLGERLPPDPDAKALEEFLVRQRRADPLRFPDLSLAIVKAMGAGEYVVESPGQAPLGHASPTSSRIVSSSPRWRARPRPTRETSWRRWPRIALRRRTPRTRWSARCASRRRPACSRIASATISTASSPGPATRERGCASCGRPSRASS